MVCPKHGSKIEGVVLHRVGILVLFVYKWVKISYLQWHAYTRTLIKDLPGHNAKTVE